MVAIRRGRLEQSAHEENWIIRVGGVRHSRADASITAVGQAARALTRCGAFEHPVLDSPGWWKRPDRFIVRRTSAGSSSGRAERPILIVGESSLAAALRTACEERALGHVSLADAEAVLSPPSKLQQISPWALVNAVSVARTPAAVGAKKRRQSCSPLRPVRLAPARLLLRPCVRRRIGPTL